MTAEYKEGQVAQLLFSQTASPKKEKHQKKLKKLANIFTVKDTDESKKSISKAVKKFAGTSSLKSVVDSPPHKEYHPPPSLESPHQEGYCPPPNVVHESLQKGNAETSHSKKRKLESEEPELEETRRKKKPRDTGDDYRTVFVGSLSNQVTKKSLKQMFNKVGKVKSVRLRGAISENEKLPKRAIVIKKKFHPNVNTLYGYVLFEDRESALKATQLNGTEMDGQILRVNMADQAQKHQHKKCVFVGNLSYKIKESTIMSHFSDCGQVEDVRLIRNKATGQCKGFAYVRFTESSSVLLALKLHESTLGGRQIRVMRSTEEGSKPKKKNKNADSWKNAAERIKKIKKNSDSSKKVFSKNPQMNTVSRHQRRSNIMKERKRKRAFKKKKKEILY